MPKQLQVALQPWTSPKILQISTPWKEPNPDFSLWTDASIEGWGALTSVGSRTQGQWNQQEDKSSINRLELRAVYLALTNLSLENKIIRLFIDNETAKFTLNRRGSRSPSIHQVIKEIWQWLLEHNCSIQAVRISSKENVAADALSRNSIQPTEWTLKRETFQKLQEWHGPLEIDLMATPLNNKLQKFVCPFHHNMAENTDALLINWNQYKQIYLFPPVNLLPRVLQKLQEYQHNGIIIAPWRPTALWFATVIDRSVEHLHLRNCVGQYVQDEYYDSASVCSVKWTAFRF